VEQHALALGEAEPEALANVLPARLERIEKGAFELGPEIFRRAPIGVEQTTPVPARQRDNRRWMQSRGISTLLSAMMIQS